VDLTLLLRGLHLQELVNLLESYDNLRDCSASHRMVKCSHLWLVVNIGTEESVGDLHRPRVQAPVVGGTLSLNFHNPRAHTQAAAAISFTSCVKGLSNNVFGLIIMEASSTTFVTRGPLNWLIPLDFCPRLLILASQASESVSAAECLCWEL